MNILPGRASSRKLEQHYHYCFLLTMLLPTAVMRQANNSEHGSEIGIIQYAPHPSLDNCYTGFVEGLEKRGSWRGEYQI